MTSAARPARVAWFTGLSGAGKSTIAELAAARLTAEGRRVAMLDGDAVRARFHRHLGFTPADIRENNRLIAELCVEALVDHDVVLVPVISPFRDARDAARDRIGAPFAEVHVKAGLETVMSRDPKGLYLAVREGRRPALIGMSADVPYEPPLHPDLVLDTEAHSAARLADALVTFLSTP